MVDTRQLMELADTSAWTNRGKHPTVRADFDALVEERRVATCPMVAMELLWTATDQADFAELRTQLYIAHDVGHLTENRFRYLMEKAEEVGRLIGGLRAKIAKPRSFSSLIPHPSSLQTCC